MHVADCKLQLACHELDTQPRDRHRSSMRLKRLNGFGACFMNLADAVEANQFQRAAYLRRYPAEFEVAAVARYVPQTGQDRATAAAIDEVDAAQVEHQLSAVD